jgi:hypothetical protein
MNGYANTRTVGHKPKHERIKAQKMVHQTTFQEARRGYSKWLLGLLTLAWLLLPGWANADIRGDLTKLQSDLNRQSSSIDFLGQSLRKLNPAGKVSLSRRLADGQINFLLRDYLRASILLLDAVENPRNKGRAQWYEAVYLLAESLNKSRNIQGAVKYYRVLVNRGKQHAQKALVRLMEIAAKTQKSSWLDQYFQQGQRLPAGRLRSKIFYLRGKGLYKLGRLSEAQTMFQRIASTTSYGPRAKYFLAVLMLQNNPQKPPVDGAIQLLSQALSGTPNNKDNAKLRDIILLSLGRLHLQKKKVKEALSYFRRIPRTSFVFDQALYEICWAYVERGNAAKKKIDKQTEYNRALNSLNLLLAFLPQSPFYPKAQLLKGNLQLQLAPFKKGKKQERLFQSAMESYQKLAVRYRRVYQEMQNVTKNRPRPLSLFEQLVSQQLDQFDVSKILPQDAIRWMSDEELMSRTLLMLKDLKEMQIQLKSARQIISRLESVLRVRSRYALSPSLREARLQTSSAKAKLTEAENKLVRMQEQLSLRHLSASERREYQNLRKQIKALRYLFLQTPKTGKELIKRSATVNNRINKLASRLHNITILLAYSNKALRSVRRWLETNQDARSLSPQQRNSLEADANQFSRMISTLSREKARLENQLSLARIQLGYASPAPQEQRIQQRYLAALQRERNFYNRIKSKMSTSDQNLLTEIQGTSRRVVKLQGKVRDYFGILERLTNSFAMRVQKLIGSEKLKLTQYEQQIFQLKGESKRLASRIAFNTFLTVRKKFRSLVLQAEVGVIDVAWREKQTIQNEKTQLSKERNSELRVLDSEFRDLVQEVK